MKSICFGVIIWKYGVCVYEELDGVLFVLCGCAMGWWVLRSAGVFSQSGRMEGVWVFTNSWIVFFFFGWLVFTNMVVVVGITLCEGHWCDLECVIKQFGRVVFWCLQTWGVPLW